MEKAENEKSEIKFIGESEKLTVEKTQEKQLSDYAYKHFLDYTFLRPEMIAVFDDIKKNAREFKENILSNPSGETVAQIDQFLAGYHDSKLLQLFKRVNFNWQSYFNGTFHGTDSERRQFFIEAFLKAQSYETAVKENADEKIELVGFADDAEIIDAQDFIYRVFGEKLLSRCLISKIIYSPSTVSIILGGITYYFPLNIYKEWGKENLEIKNYKCRAESLNYWNLDPAFSKKFIPLPIFVYSFIDEKPQSLAYLKNIPKEQQMRLYKLGTISHEIGHSIYAYLLDSDQRQNWQRVFEVSHFSTEYSQKFLQKSGKYEEAFCEAIRLITTVPQYLETNFPVVYNFLIQNFPDLKSSI